MISFATISQIRLHHIQWLKTSFIGSFFGGVEAEQNLVNRNSLCDFAGQVRCRLPKDFQGVGKEKVGIKTLILLRSARIQVQNFD